MGKKRLEDTIVATTKEEGVDGEDISVQLIKNMGLMYVKNGETKKYYYVQMMKQHLLNQGLCF